MPTSSDDTPLSPVNTQPGQLPPDGTHDSLQRTSSWQSTASAGSSASGGGSSSRTGPVPVPVPKPRSSASSQTAAAEEVEQAPSRRPGRETRRRPVPGGQAETPGGRSQSSPGDRVKTTVPQYVPSSSHLKSTTPSRNGVVPGRSGIPRTTHQVDRSLGSTESPLAAFVDRTGLVFDVRSKAAYRRGRLLGKVRSHSLIFVYENLPFASVIRVCSGGSVLGPGGTEPPNLAQPPPILIGSIVISLSRCCLPNDEGPGPQIVFPEPPLRVRLDGGWGS